MRTPRWLMVIMAIFAVFAMLAFAACGGGDDDDDDGGDGSATATQTQGGGDDGGDDETATPTEAGDDGGDDGGDTEDIFAELDDLTGDLEAVEGKVTYEVTDSDGTTSSITFTSKPPNSRFESTDDGTTSIIITTPDTTYICDSSSESCLATPGSGDDSGLGIFGSLFSADVIGAYVQIAEQAGVNVDKSDESINGIDATCFSWEESTDLEVDEGKLCFNDDGVMVYEEFADDSGITKLEATDYSSDVSDSEFEPPYDVTELPSS